MKTVRLAHRFYRVTYLDCTWTWPADSLGTARVVTLLRGARGWSLPIEVTPFLVEKVEPACAWCLARPRALIWIGPGRRESRWCDAPQCQVAHQRALANGAARMADRSDDYDSGGSVASEREEYR